MAYFKCKNTREKGTIVKTFYASSSSGGSVPIPLDIGISNIKGCGIVNAHVRFYPASVALVQSFPTATLSGRNINIGDGGPTNISSVSGTFVVWGE